MATIKIVQTDKQYGSVKILDLEEAVKKLSGWYSDINTIEQDLLKGNQLQSAFCYFKKVEDKNGNN